MTLELAKAQRLKSRLTNMPSEALTLGISLLAGCLFILVLDVVLGAGGRAAKFWLDQGDPNFPFPFTIQDAEHLLFFIALGELYLRRKVANHEMAFLARHYLPEDDETVLELDDLGPLRRKVAGNFDSDNGFLPYLIDLSILQVQASRSVDQTVSVLNSTLDLMSHKVDLRYQVLRYLTWAIPTFGFIGTVAGIASALMLISPQHMDLKAITGNLAVAFDTTIIALIYSAIIVLLLNLIQKQEELALNRAGSYCLKNLINRLYVTG